jgi:hypothetical protein
MKRPWLALIAVAGCGGSSTAPSPYVAGFAPPASPSGYTRYVAPTVHQVPPGSDMTLCQWLAGASDADVDVADVFGHQSVGGHHVVLYASKNIKEPIGTSRPCTPEDSEGSQFLGAIGGEGISGKVGLPPGLVFRVPKGRSLMANVHYINATRNPIDGQSVVDVKFAAASPSSHPVGFLSVISRKFEIPAQQAYAIDRYCKAPKDLSLFMFANHLHEHGRSIFNEVIRPDASKEILATDETWRPELTFNATWSRWDVATPMVVKAGEQFHLHCEWQSNVDRPMVFPEEMCLGIGVFLEGGDVVCQATETL